jgi:hypothetical protein
MTRADFMAAIYGEATGLVAGVSWVPAEALIGLVGSLQLDFGFVPAEQARAAETAEQLHALDAAAVWTVSGVFGRVAASLGWSEALRMSVGEPGAMAGHLAEALHEALVAARSGVAAGADVVLVADDLAGASGPLVSPDYALDALIPCYRAIATEALEKGLSVAFHSDGDIRTLMPALARAGFSAVHLAGIPADGVSVAVAAARDAGMAAIGGIAAATVVDEPVAGGRRAAELAVGSGLLVCDDGGLVTGQDLAAFGLAIQAAREAFAEDPERG